MDPLTWTTDPLPDLRAPILVAAFEGLFDVGRAATGAVEALSEGAAVEVAHIDSDPFFDFTEQRPIARIDHDGARVIHWPGSRVYCLPLPERSRDLVLVEGVEPHLLWRTFSDTIATIAERLGAAMVVTLGAMIAEVPHTRPLGVTGSTADPQLADALRLDQPSYEGPTGVVGVIQERLARDNMPAVSLRVRVPHYVSGSPNPKASRSLLERFERVSGLPTRWSDLDEEARDWEGRVNRAMADDDDMIRYVGQLEERFDRQAASSLPNADDLAAEFERFLRQHDD